MTDRYDDLMLGLYQGFVPAWLPAASHELYRRESLRRRCDLGQTLATDYRCTVYCAQALYSPDFVQDVCAAWPATRFHAGNVTTGLYLALDGLLAATAGADAVRELLHYEALAVADLRCAPRAPRVDPPALADAEVYRFGYAIPEMHARMTLYAGARAPAAFVREFVAPLRTTLIARARAGRGWVVSDVTHLDERAAQETEHEPTTAA